MSKRRFPPPRLLAVALLASCGRSAPPPEAVASGLARAPTVSSAPAPSAAAAAPAPLPSTRGGDGCWGLELPAAPAARLETLGARCAPGLKRLFDEAPVLGLAASGEATLPLPPLPPNACVRAAAISAEGPVALVLLEGSSEEVALDAHPAFSLAPLEGPLCLGPEGRATLRLRRAAAGPEAAAGRVWVQAWASAAARLSGQKAPGRTLPRVASTRRTRQGGGECATK